MVEGLESLPWVRGALSTGARTGDRQLALGQGDRLRVSSSSRVYLRRLSHGEVHSTSIHCDSTLGTVTVLDGPHLTR